jgi:DNA-binding response OmpR family regulator
VGPGRSCHTERSGFIVSEVNILIIDDDSASQRALQQVFDAEGWRISVVPVPDEAMRELARGRWTLAVANVALADVTGPLFTTLKTLAQTEVGLGRDQKMLRVLFLVPALVARRAQPVLEHEGLPFVSKPFHLHDLLEKVSDLLMEVNAIPRPLRDTQLFAATRERKQRERRSGSERRRGQMFASREDYMMTEEEIADFERQEEAERKKRLEDAKKRDVL